MEIKIDRYILRSDTYQYVLDKTQISKSGKSKGELMVVNSTYHSKLSDVFKYILDQKIRDSEATTLEQLMEDIKKAKEFIEEFFDIENLKLKG